MAKKILIIRFSSIGDIVLTTPVIRCLKQQLPATELHFVIKATFRPLLSENPWLDRIHTFEKDVSELFDELRKEKFDLLVDLHNNLRSLRLKQHLGVKSTVVDKINFRKFLAVNFKMIGVLPDKHIVNRYLDTVSVLGVRDDGKGLDYFISPADEVNVKELLAPGTGKFAVLVAGGSYFTKQIPFNKLVEICNQLNHPIVVMGGKEDSHIAETLLSQFPMLVNACGVFSLSQSASIIRQAEWVITSDTGLMHIASAFQKKIISIWGNTIPEFGMAPYRPHPESRILEIKKLKCRPCSKLGYHKCPKGHFKCMNDIDTSFAGDL